MLRKTHISLGIATALAVIHPATVSGCLFVVMGGAIGGWIPDVDLNSRKISFSFICTPAGEHFQCFVPDTRCSMKKEMEQAIDGSYNEREGKQLY